jgi:hypothetical protein
MCTRRLTWSAPRFGQTRSIKVLWLTTWFACSTSTTSRSMAREPSGTASVPLVKSLFPMESSYGPKLRVFL